MGFGFETNRFEPTVILEFVFNRTLTDNLGRELLERTKHPVTHAEHGTRRVRRDDDDDDDDTKHTPDTRVGGRGADGGERGNRRRG